MKKLLALSIIALMCTGCSTLLSGIMTGYKVVSTGIDFLSYKNNEVKKEVEVVKDTYIAVKEEKEKEIGQ